MRDATFKRNYTRGQERLQYLNEFQTEHMACWYGGILKSKTLTVPKVLVHFWPLQGSTVSSEVVSKSIPLTDLSQVRLGTIWKEGYCTGEAEFDEETFKLDFTDGNWQFTSPFAHRQNTKLLIQPEDYKLPYPADKNYLLEFQAGGKTILVPCLVFYSRCYGCSSEVRRIVATYPWEEACRRMFSPVTDFVPKGFWPVTLGLRLVNDDAVFVAHVQHDPYSAGRVKEIYSQLEAAFTPQNNLAFIKVAPWFEGEASLMLRGLWINEGNTFLGLQVRGCSEPTGASIARDRVNTNKTDGIAPGDKEGWSGKQNKILRERNPIIITGDHDPDQGSSSVDVPDPDFVRLEPYREVRDIRRPKTLTVPGSGRNAQAEGSFSSGEAHGGNKNVGHASFRPSIIMESKGVLRDMWDALLTAAKRFPGIIQSVEWFTLEDNFSSAIESRLIALKVDDEGKDPKLVSKESKRWCYIDDVHRGILVVRLRIKDRELYLVEIQRRAWNSKKTDLAVEEKFKGLIVELDNKSDFDGWIRNLVFWIPHVMGVVQKLVGSCPGKAAVFKHSHNNIDKEPGMAALRNALSKMDIELPTNQTE